MLEGTATAAGTARFKDRSVADRGVPPGHFRMAPGGLTLSTLGLGTYLGRPDAATDLAVQDAVAVSVRSGRVNVVDTAINYRHQRAERSVGRGIAHLVEQGVAPREELFIATKVGYLAPDGESALPPDDIVDGVHSMAPGYLSDQIDRSRRNLGLETIDLLYLHNAADAQLPVVGPEEFRRRLVIAFERLEEHRESGHLQCYGLATWEVLRVPIGDPVHLALADLVEIAKEAGGSDHGFRFVQFPFNRSMPEAFERANQPVDGETVPLFEAARRLGIGCFTSVPLLQGQLTKGAKEGAMTAAQSALQYARSVPGTIGPLVGSKSPAHLAEDLGVASFPPRTD
ncbi:MAG: aldo/keto reductase [Thermoplasmata archaeon]|nr:aldo/keto reductase [Thermoplasmata archaeon]